MDYKCTRCGGTGTDPHLGGNCIDCGGDGQKTAEGFHQETHQSSIDARERIIAIETTLDNLDTKLDALDTHLGVIETKIDALE